jgi:hypothetical protein
MFHADFLLDLLCDPEDQRRYVPPIHRVTFKGLYGIISQMLELFIMTVVRDPNPTLSFFHLFRHHFPPFNIQLIFILVFIIPLPPPPLTDSWSSFPTDNVASCSKNSDLHSGSISTWFEFRRDIIPTGVRAIFPGTSRQVSGHYLKLSHNCFLLKHFQFIVHYHSIA